MIFTTSKETKETVLHHIDHILVNMIKTAELWGLLKDSGIIENLLKYIYLHF